MNDIIALDLGITISYLIQNPEGYMLVDTGYPKSWDTFLGRLSEKGIALDDINLVFLTHHHDDHAGFLKCFLDLRDVPVIMHHRAPGPLKKGESDETDEEAVTRRVKWIFGIYMLFHNKFTFPPVYIREKDILLKEDDNRLLRDWGIAGEVVMTPGHTYDSISIVLDDGNAVVGDAAMNIMHICGADYRPIYQMNRREVFESWEKLFRRDVKNLYTGHGRPFPVDRLRGSFGRHAK